MKWNPKRNSIETVPKLTDFDYNSKIPKLNQLIVHSQNTDIRSNSRLLAKSCMIVQNALS